MKNIPLVSPILGEDEKNILCAVIDSKIIASGKYVADFEAACANAWGAKFGIATSNGTTALHAALIASGIGKGDEVLTTPFSFIATSNSIMFCGAKPVFADIDSNTYNISALNAEAVLKKRKSIKAILLVHLYGLPCDMDAFMKLKKKYGVKIIEDCAQAHGAKFNGKTVGSIGDAGAFSFYATKNMTTGEGGIVLTSNALTDKTARSFINHGRKGHSTHSILGHNFRLTNLAAGIGLVQLAKLSEWNRKRRSNAEYLNNGLRGLSFISVPFVPEKCGHVYHQYTIRVKSGLRDKLTAHLSANGVGAGIYYPYAIYRQEYYARLGYKKGLCPEAEKAAKEVISLPVHPALTQDDLAVIVNAVKSFKP